MIKQFVLENCGPLERIEWTPSPYINLVIGKNGTGKSLMLKMLYVALRSTEEYGRGDNTDKFKAVLNKKLLHTFQVDEVGDLVKKGENRLKLECELDDQKLSFSFSPSAAQGVGDASEIVKHRSAPLSLFLPPKEILSLTSIISISRNQYRLRGFDDTYLDLTNALEGEPQKGRNYANLTDARKRLGGLLNGRLERVGRKWIFKEGNAKHSIHVTAEGIKRLALIDRLIGNRSLKDGSVLFIDEPEAMLHPRAIVEFMEILHLLSQQNIQIFLASHSYFVLKSLYVIAKREQSPFSVCSLAEDNKYTIADLSDDIPDNPIIDESIALYEREVEVELNAGAYTHVFDNNN